jgi:hypothetical protein
MNNPQKPFEPDHLIRLLHAQYPHRTDVLRALQLCSTDYWQSNDYISFLRSRNPGEHNSDNMVVETLLLEDEPERVIRVEVVEDGRIAGIGYVSR